jgi:hypothetical protein
MSMVMFWDFVAFALLAVFFKDVANTSILF